MAMSFFVVFVSIFACSSPSIEASELSLAETADIVAPVIVEVISLLLKELGSNASPPQILFGIKNTSVYGGCKTDGGRKDVPGSFFCGYTNTILLEPIQLEEFRQRNGDGAVAYAIAHEAGHWFQAQDFMRQNTSQLGRVDIELQADCIAGYLLNGLSNQIGLDPSDRSEAIRTAFSIGSVSHGSGQMRAIALSRGLDGRQNALAMILSH